MEKQHHPSAEQSSSPSRPPACGNRMCDLCTETRCWMLRREADEQPSKATAPPEPLQR